MVAWIQPKIVYPSSVLFPPTPTTLNFKYQPRHVQFFSYEAVRHDNRASSGVQEVIYERTDEFFNADMEYVTTSDSDVANWQTFLQSAIQGIPFDYYPDPVGAPTTFTTYFADDKNYAAEYKAPGVWTFSMKWYKYVTWP